VEGEEGPEGPEGQEPSERRTWRIRVSSSAVMLGLREMNPAFDSPFPKVPSSISSSLLNSSY
jgi:hypothetical protein